MKKSRDANFYSKNNAHLKNTSKPLMTMENSNLKTAIAKKILRYYANVILVKFPAQFTLKISFLEVDILNFI